MPTDSEHQPTGWVVSDLHLFAQRSDGEARMREFLPRMNGARALVLNGDIVDFRWSTRRSHRETAAHGASWLRGLVTALQACEVHYVLGNHDCLPELRSELAALSRSFSNFQWHEYSLQLGDVLFLHGDCTHRHMDAGGLEVYRDGWSRDRRRGELATTAYRAADRLGLTRLVHRWHFPLEQTLQRLTHHLDHAHGGWHKRIRHCYFGHTHDPFSNIERSGVNFHNTGCAIRGMNFNPLSFPLPANGPAVKANTCHE